MHLKIFLEPSQAMLDWLTSQVLSQYWQYASVSRLTQASHHLLLECIGFTQENQSTVARYLYQGESQVDRDIAALPLFIAQPVSYVLQRDSITLGELTVLSSREYKQATELLNTHFSAESVTFIPSDSQQYWYVQLPITHITTQLPHHAMQQDIHAYQPQGEGATQLKQIMNVAQMLLHDHAINDAREEGGLPVFNSIWLYGGGQAETPLLDTNHAVMGNTPLIQAIQQQSDMPTYEHLDALLAHQPPSAVMHLQSPQAVDWPALFAQVKRRKIRQLRVYIPMANETLYIHLTPVDCYRFWRKPRQVEQVLQNLKA